MIFESLKLPTQHCAVVNKFCVHEEVQEKLSCVAAQHQSVGPFMSTIGGDEQSQPQLSCYFPNSEESVRFPKQEKTSNGFFDYYLLDASSLLPVLALDICPDNTVLDMCAAPGGKSVLISQFLSIRGCLVASEVANQRRANLIKVVKDYIPKISKTKDLVHVRSLTGLKYGEYEPNTYDRVLLDVPCSSERHNLHTNFEFSFWSEKHSTENANMQGKLLMSALQTVVPGGVVIYSTCSMSPIENDGVIDEVLSKCTVKKQLKVEVVDSQFENNSLAKMFDYRTTKHGVLVVPSKTKNWGPMYFCKLQRLTI